MNRTQFVCALCAVGERKCGPSVGTVGSLSVRVGVTVVLVRLAMVHRNI